VQVAFVDLSSVDFGSEQPSAGKVRELLALALAVYAPDDLISRVRLAVLAYSRVLIRGFLIFFILRALKK
jgi:hypothetical protein